MFIALTPKRALEKDEKGKFLVPISIDVGEVHSFYIPMYDTYEEAVKDSPNNTILELPITAEMDMLEIEVVPATDEIPTPDTTSKKATKNSDIKKSYPKVEEEAPEDINLFRATEAALVKSKTWEKVLHAGDSVQEPDGVIPPAYNLEDWDNYGHLLLPGEMVVVTEKIHGVQAHFSVYDGQQYCGSHNQWNSEDPENVWWRCLAENSWITTFCQLRPNLILYGEIFGSVNNKQPHHKYGAQEDEIFFRAFDIFDKDTDTWMDFTNISALFNDLSFGSQLGTDWVPVLFYGDYDEVEFKKLMNCKSNIKGADHLQDGLIIQTLTERKNNEIGRVKLKK
jgi:hypothetical protein